MCAGGLASVSIVDTDLSKGFTGLARNRGDEERQGLETSYAICFLFCFFWSFFFFAGKNPAEEESSTEKQIARVLNPVGTHQRQFREQKTCLGI